MRELSKTTDHCQHETFLWGTFLPSFGKTYTGRCDFFSCKEAPGILTTTRSVKMFFSSERKYVLHFASYDPVTCNPNLRPAVYTLHADFFLPHFPFSLLIPTANPGPWWMIGRLSGYETKLNSLDMMQSEIQKIYMILFIIFW